MRYPLLASILAVGTSSIALAGPGGSPLTPLVPAELPTACRALAEVPASATITDPDFAAHVSVANCLAEAAMSDLVLRPDGESLTALDVAAAPSMTILEEVRARGDDHWRAIADNSKADLLLGMVVRMRSATNDPDDHGGIESSLARWIDVAANATREAAALGHRQQVGDARDTLDHLTELALRATPEAFRPVAIRVIRRELAVENELMQDRAWRDAEAAQVNAVAHRLAVDEGREVAFKAAWDLAVAADHPNVAGALAPRHHETLVDEVRDRARLEQARTTLAMAEQRLAADRQRLSRLEARVESLVDQTPSAPLPALLPERCPTARNSSEGAGTDRNTSC